MKDYQIVKINNDEYKFLIVMKTYEAPFQYLNDISRELMTEGVAGTVLIDQLMHSGNNDERFISGFFDGSKFINSSFKFVNIDRRSPLRKSSCDLLRDNPEVIEYSILSGTQKKLIYKGCYI